MNYLDNIKELIENDIVLKKKHRLEEKYNNQYFSSFFDKSNIYNKIGEVHVLLVYYKK